MKKKNSFSHCIRKMWQIARIFKLSTRKLFMLTNFNRGCKVIGKDTRSQSQYMKINFIQIARYFNQILQ